MVLRLKARESRSLPGQKSQFVMICDNVIFSEIEAKVRATDINAGWSSPVARQAHNLKVAGSNPAPATNITNFQKTLASGWPTSSCLNIGQLKHIPVKIFGGCAFSILLKVQ